MSKDEKRVVRELIEAARAFMPHYPVDELTEGRPYEPLMTTEEVERLDLVIAEAEEILES